MGSKRVLYLSQEITPYIEENEISSISRYLPQYMQEEGHEMRIFMPRYGLVNERRNQLHEVIRLSGLNVVIDDNDHPLIIKVASVQPARMQVYFIDNEDFFKRKSMYGADKSGVNDNDERSIFFVRGVFEAVRKLRWIPDVIHCHGLFTALAVIYLKKVYQDDPCLKKAKIVYSIYKEEQPVEIPETLFEKFKFDGIRPQAYSMMEGKTDMLALTRLAAHYAHGLVRGSQELPEELEELLKESTKPQMEHPFEEQNYGKAYSDFYQQLK